MVKITESEIVAHYLAFMKEIKTRLSVVRRTLGEILVPGANLTFESECYIKAELCYLQIRKAIETLAIAVLIAHNTSITFRDKKLLDEWNGAALFKRILKLNENGFPKPIILPQQVAEGRGGMFHVLPDGYVDREHIIAIHHKAAHGLHSGEAAIYLSKNRLNYDIAELVTWHKDLTELLNTHIVMLPNLRVLVTMMHDEKGNVRCALRAFPDMCLYTRDEMVAKYGDKYKLKPKP